MSIILHTSFSIGSAGKKCEVFASHVDLPIEIVRRSPPQWKSPEYMQIHPWGKIPTLETPEGYIFQSLSILRYMARKTGKGYGNSPIETASVDQWLEFYLVQFYQIALNILRDTLGHKKTTKQLYESNMKMFDQLCGIMNQHLSKNNFFGAKQPSISDFAFAVVFQYPFRLICDEKWRNKHENLTKWFIEMNNLPAIKKHFGKLWLCSQVMVPEFQQIKKVEKPKKEQPKKQAKKQIKKQQPKKQKKEQEQEPEEAPKKKVNPLDQLPKSTFNIDDWKRQFVNSQDTKAAMKDFWTKLDTQGWSIWKSHYIKDESEGKVGYLTANLKNGFLRNLDHFRKYTFGVLGVYGTEGKFQIDGAWLWRGLTIPEQWKEHQSFQYFQFEKLDPSKQQHRNLVEDYWLKLNEGDIVQGQPVFEAKWFK